MKIWFLKRLRKKDDIKTNLLRKNTDFFGKNTRGDINVSTRSKSQSHIRKIIDISPFSQIFLRSIKHVHTIK